MVRLNSSVRIFLLGLLLSSACSGTQSESEPPLLEDANTYRLAVGVGLLTNVYTPRLERLKVATGELKTLAQAEHERVQSGEPFERAALQTAWMGVMEVVQELEVMHVGPGANATTRKGGENLRDALYSWPITNTCRVDQVTVSGIFAEDGFKARVMANVYGLDALEELLFRDGDFHTCPPQLPIASEGQWDALGAEGLARNKAHYASVIANELHNDAILLQDKWAADGANFMAQAETPGADSVFASPQCLLDELFGAMFHIDLITKDRRLAVPTGISPDCTTASCANKLEFQRATVSGLSVQRNLIGLSALFTGESGDGFDALLRAEGADDLADEMQTAISEAVEMARALEVDWAVLLESDPESLRDLHGKVKAITDLFKTQFATVLNLSVPQEGAADND
jgi:predicted lipoprotein